MYDYTLTVSTKYGSTTTTHSFTGSRAVVNRSASEFGKGWWLDGLDRLVTSSTGALLVTGSGATRWYPKSGSTYLPAEGDLSESTLTTGSGSTYLLTDKHGTVATFSSLGLLTSIEDTNGNTVTYAYSDQDGDSVADELVSITDPFSRSTTLSYSGGKVSQVSHFSGRSASLTQSSGKLTTITLLTQTEAEHLAHQQ